MYIQETCHLNVLLDLSVFSLDRNVRIGARNAGGLDVYVPRHPPPRGPRITVICIYIYIYMHTYITLI